MKYNLGCGNQYIYGWVNIDQFPAARPDKVMDLEKFPWSIEDNSADEVLLSHVLEHLGGDSSTFLNVMKELYRICKPGAKVVIRVPDPRHDDFLSDPTHQRPIVPGLFQTFDLTLNEMWVAHGLPGTPLGKYLGIDFLTDSVTSHFDPEWNERSATGLLDNVDTSFAQRSYNNMVQWWEIVIVTQKPFSPGRSLRRFDALIINRHSGLGDVLMALSAAAAIKAATGIPIFLNTSPAYVDFANQSPAVDKVFSDISELQAELGRIGSKAPHVVDWAPARFGISRFHQVDAYLMSLGLTLRDTDKGLHIILPSDKQEREIDMYLNHLPPGAKKVVIHAGETDPNRTWPQTFWTEITQRLLLEGHAVVLIGASDSVDKRSVISISNPVVLDLTDKLDFNGTLRVLRKCDVLISNDSGPIQLAGASDIGIVGLYSVAAGDCRMPYRKGSASYKTIAIVPECPFHPCYPKINDESVLNRFSAENGITDQNAATLFGTWCISEARYSCTQEVATTNKVLFAVSQLISID